MANPYKRTYKLKTGTAIFSNPSKRKGKKGRVYKHYSPNGKYMGKIFVPNK